MGRPIIVRFSYRTVVVPVFFIRSPRYALLVPDTAIVRVEFQLKFDLAAVARAGAESEPFQQRACRPVAWAGSRVGSSFGVAEPLGGWTLGWEGEVQGCLVRHVAVHVRDLSVELLAIHFRDACVCGVGSHADSVAER